MAFKLLRKSKTLGLLLDIDGERTPFETIQVACYAPGPQAGCILWGQHAETQAFHVLDGVRVRVKDAPKKLYEEWALEFELDKITCAGIENSKRRFHPLKTYAEKTALGNYPIKIRDFDIRAGFTNYSQFKTLEKFNASQYRTWPRCREIIESFDGGDLDVEAGAMLFALSLVRPEGSAGQSYYGKTQIPGFY